MSRKAHTYSIFAHRNPTRALDDWREAERLVSTRWEVFLEAEREVRQWAFASYVAALDAEEAAARHMAAHLTARAA